MWLNLLRFYAPWCGHCQNLKPAYEKAAKSLNGLAQVAAINCDDESNKAFCGGMGVQGFPTLKIIKPSKVPGKPIVEDYQGPRTATGISDAVKLAIPNHVEKVTDKTLNGWFETNNDTTKAVLFSDKGTTGALMKVLSAEFLGSVKIAQIRNKETAAVEMFGVTDFPTLILLPGGNQEPVKFDGVFSKGALREFLTKHTSPRSEHVQEKQKPLTKKAKKEVNEDPEKPKQTDLKAEVTKPEVVQTAETQPEEVSSGKESSSSSDTSDEIFPEATTIILGDPSQPTESPEPIAVPEVAPKPAAVPNPFPPIPEILDEKYLQKQCLGAKTNTCLLALLPLAPATDDGASIISEASMIALASLAKLTDKHAQRGSKLFPFYAVPAKNLFAATLRDALKLGDEMQFEIIAVNSRRGWWRHYKHEDFNFNSVESWVDSIRFGEGEKGQLPEELISVEERPQGHEEL